MKIKKTERGFGIVEFTDRYGVECSIQKSSLATEDAIWFGANEIGLRKHVPYSGKGFKPVNTKCTPTVEYVANNRMHLTRKQVKKLLPILKHFAKTGELD